MPRLFVILLACLMGQIHAHESPSHSLKQLNQHIQENPKPELFFQRAMAYKALGKINKAAADLQIAIKARPEFLPWQIERSRVELTAQRPANALNIANQALKLTKTGSQRAEVHILRAEAYQATGKHKPSLHACQLAFKELPAGKIEWFLLRSENQRQLGLHQQRLQGLKAGLKIYPNTIIKSHWVDALIDASQYSQALTHIDQELIDLRWKSSWLIKRARSLIGLKRNAEAQSDLTTALEEIQQRLNPARPDIFLLADQGIAYILLGNTDKARNSLDKLYQQHAPRWVTNRLKSLIK